MPASCMLGGIIIDMSSKTMNQSVTEPRPNIPAFFIEIVLIVIAAIFAASIYADFTPNKRLGGTETEYLTRTAYTLGTLLREKGRIPLWDPYMEMGDPMLENPVSFAFNPFAIWPSILFGPYNGVKLSIILTAIVAGLGGWALARVIGLGPLARLLLAFLCIGKGNMHSYLAQGHFAFFLSQSCFPWIFAGVIGMLRGYRRWPLIMTVLGFALVFWSGSPWYPPAIVIVMMVLVACYAIKRPPAKGDEAPYWWSFRVDWRKVGIVVFSIALTAVLAAVTTLPLWNMIDKIGGSGIFTDYRTDLGVIFSGFFNEVKEIQNTGKFIDGQAFAWYSFVTPFWYALLIVALLVLAWGRRKLPAINWRVFIAAIFLFFFCSLWGAGRNPIIELSYQIIPFANQFRHVERVLAVASLWLAVAIAICVDSLWNYLVRTPVWASFKKMPAKRVARPLFAVLLILTSSIASYQVLSRWHESWGTFFTRTEDNWENYCATWLRRQHPGEQLSVWTIDYRNVYTYFRNEIRHGWVASDFYHARPAPSTVFAGNFIPSLGGPVELLPEYAFGPPQFDVEWLLKSGYQPVAGSANPYSENQPCVYRRDGAFSYAFAVTRADLNAHTNLIPVSFTVPITTFARDYDHVAVIAQARTDNDLVVTVQEVNYPGWTVTVDGNPATLESVGGQIGVILPRDGAEHRILFRFIPLNLYVGGIITLITSLLCVLYLLRFDRFLPKHWISNPFKRIAEEWDVKA